MYAGGGGHKSFTLGQGGGSQKFHPYLGGGVKKVFGYRTRIWPAPPPPYINNEHSLTHRK